MSGIDRDTIERALVDNDRPLGAILGLLTTPETADLLSTVEALIRQARYDALTEAAEAIGRATASYTTEGNPPDEAPWDLFTRPHAARLVRSLRDQEGA